MPLVTVIDIFFDSELLQCEHATDTEKNILLDAVLPVATVKGMSD